MSKEEIISIPVMEIEWSTFVEICEKNNFIDTLIIYSMPEHSKTYSNRDKVGVSDLIQTLYDYSIEENAWRLEKKIIVDIKVENNVVKFLDKQLFGSERIIVVPKTNSIYLFPNEESIKNGGFRANEILQLCNLVSTKMFLMKFVEEPNEDGTNFDVKIEYELVKAKKVEYQLVEDKKM